MFKLLKKEMEKVIEEEVHRFLREDAGEIIDRELSKHLNSCLGAKLAGQTMKEVIHKQVKKEFKDHFGY